MRRDVSDDREQDASLLLAWRGGDDRAGERLFDRHADAVARFFENKVCQGADDLIQATFLRMLEGRDQIREVRAFRAYVFGIARNVLREHLRELGRGRQVDPEVDSMAQLAPGPTSVVGQREEHRLLLEGLRHLPVEDQLLLELFYWEGLRGPALGEILGVTPSSVRSRLARARARLERAMAQLAAPAAVLASTVEGLDGWAAELRASMGGPRDGSSR
ncbi:MAG: sigma-70 family RNA polymerase sigma factor [Myxococcales bacterium]|nr:sigma-70 family RNA polymerase sigma factor [Myxococcales bacterium]